MGFERILVGVDGSEGSLEALRQAGRLLDPGGHLLAATVCDVTLAVHAGFQAARVAAELEAEAAAALEKARHEIGDLEGREARVLEGKPSSALLGLAGRERADLVAVGAHRGSRAGGIVLGSVATTMLHDAPCSVLVARAPSEPGQFPRAIVVGLDGSPQSNEAAAGGVELAERFGVTLRILVAQGGKPLDTEGLRRAAVSQDSTLEWDARHPVEALTDASRGADLLIVGSRGLHGLSALGSVSERVAHQAACSVLVVRPVGHSPAGEATSPAAGEP